MWNRHNVHKMFINIYRNPKTRNWFRYKTFIHLFEFKGYLKWGERDTIFLCWLLLHRQLSTQPTHGACSAQIHLASPSSESWLSCSEAGTQLTAFSQIPKSSAHASSAWHHSHPLVSIPEWHILSALMLHLTNPYAKRKVLSLTKPKGKIYKMKFLSNYITPVTFTYSLSSEAVIMRQLRRWKRLWRRSLTCSHKRTSMGPSRSCWNSTTRALQLEEITSKGSRVSYMFYQ